MQADVSTAIRAHLLVSSFSKALATAPTLIVADIFSLLDGGTDPRPFQTLTFAVSIAIALLLRLAAPRAFAAAPHMGKVALPRRPGEAYVVDNHCNRAWLVQLHLELRGHRCVS